MNPTLEALEGAPEYPHYTRPAEYRGRRVPDDLAVVGYNDVPMADCFDPPLTTVRLDGEPFAACS